LTLLIHLRRQIGILSSKIVHRGQLNASPAAGIHERFVADNSYQVRPRITRVGQYLRVQRDPDQCRLDGIFRVVLVAGEGQRVTHESING
jgi:hypothetical protein